MALNIWGKRYTRKDVEAVALPKTTETYIPVPHMDFADLIQDTLEDHGFRLGETAHVLNQTGTQYFGMAELQNGDNPEDYSLMAGWRNSYNKTLAAALVIGARVFVCDNLAFSGEIIIGRKHTRNVKADLPGCIDLAVSQVTRLRSFQDRRYQWYKDNVLPDDMVNELIVESIRTDIVPASKAGLLIQECYEPRHRAHLNERGQRTAWTVFNAVTESLKNSSIPALPRRTQALHGMIDDMTRLDAWQNVA